MPDSRLPFTGAWFRVKRTEAGIVTTDPRVMAVISQASLSRFERGNGRIYLDCAVALCDLYGVELGALVKIMQRERDGDFA